MRYSNEIHIQTQNTILPVLNQYSTVAWRTTFNVYTTFNFVNINIQTLNLIRYCICTTSTKVNLMCKWVVWQGSKLNKRHPFIHLLLVDRAKFSTSHNKVSISWVGANHILPYVFTSTTLRSNLMRLSVKNNTTIDLQATLTFFFNKLNYYFILNTLIKQKQLFSFWSYNFYSHCTKMQLKPLKSAHILFQTTSFKFL